MNNNENRGMTPFPFFKRIPSLMKTISLLVIFIHLNSCVSLKYSDHNYHNDFFDSREVILDFYNQRYEDVLNLENDYLITLSNYEDQERFRTLSEIRHRAYTMSSDFDEFTKKYQRMLAIAIETLSFSGSDMVERKHSNR